MLSQVPSPRPLLWTLVGGLLLVAGIAAAQPVGQDSGPVSEISRPLGEGRPVSSGRGPTLGQSSDIVHSGPVSGSSVGSMISGPVSELSSGPVTYPRPVTDGGSITENSAGAVKKDIASPLGERISDPIHELAPLQARLRILQEQLNRPATLGVDVGQLAGEEVPIEEEALDAGGNPAAEEPVHGESQGAEGAGEALPEEDLGGHPREVPADAEESDEGGEVYEAPAEAEHEAPAAHEGDGAAAAPEAGEHPAAGGGEEELPGEGF